MNCKEYICDKEEVENDKGRRISVQVRVHKLESQEENLRLLPALQVGPTISRLKAYYSTLNA